MPEEFQSNINMPTISDRHFVIFYQDPHYPVEIVCDYLAEGLSQGEAAVAVVVAAHAELINKELHSRGFRIDEMTQDGRFACVDIFEPLAYLLDPKNSNAEKHALSARWIEETLKRAPANRCRFLGELVSLMVAGGRLDS